MELTLELGHKSVSDLKASMLHRDFIAWRIYAARKGLPTRRLTLQLARVAQAFGGGKLSDWLLDTPADDAKPLTSEEGAAALDTIADGIGVRKLGQGRKKKVGS